MGRHLCACLPSPVEVRGSSNGVSLPWVDGRRKDTARGTLCADLAMVRQEWIPQISASGSAHLGFGRRSISGEVHMVALGEASCYECEDAYAELSGKHIRCASV